MPKVVDIEERRAELAAAAAQLIARAGVGAATMRDVAAEAGWTTGALTHYFADKRALLLYTFRASLAGRHAARDARHALPPHEALLRALEGALPLDEDGRRHWMVTVAFCAQAAGDEELSDAQRDAYREFRGNIAELVRALGPPVYRLGPEDVDGADAAGGAGAAGRASGADAARGAGAAGGPDAQVRSGAEQPVAVGAGGADARAEQPVAVGAGDADARAEQLIAVADGIALQALFDPVGWPADRQVETLHRTIGPLLPR